MSYTTTDGDVWCCERCYRLAQESDVREESNG